MAMPPSMVYSQNHSSIGVCRSAIILEELEASIFEKYNRIAAKYTVSISLGRTLASSVCISQPLSTSWNACRNA
jgi:hypothetical protein